MSIRGLDCSNLNAVILDKWIYISCDVQLVCGKVEAVIVVLCRIEGSAESVRRDGTAGREASKQIPSWKQPNKTWLSPFFLFFLLFFYYFWVLCFLLQELLHWVRSTIQRLKMQCEDVMNLCSFWLSCLGNQGLCAVWGWAGVALLLHASVQMGSSGFVILAEI